MTNSAVFNIIQPFNGFEFSYDMVHIIVVIDVANFPEMERCLHHIDTAT